MWLFHLFDLWPLLTWYRWFRKHPSSCWLFATMLEWAVCFLTSCGLGLPITGYQVAIFLLKKMIDRGWILVIDKTAKIKWNNFSSAQSWGKGVHSYSSGNAYRLMQTLSDFCENLDLPKNPNLIYFCRQIFSFVTKTFFILRIGMLSPKTYTFVLFPLTEYSRVCECQICTPLLGHKKRFVSETLALLW